MVLCISHFSHVRYTSRPLQTNSFDRPNNLRKKAYCLHSLRNLFQSAKSVNVMHTQLPALQKNSLKTHVCSLHKISNFVISEAYGSLDDTPGKGGPCVLAVNTATRIARVHLMTGRNCATKPCLCQTR